MYWLIAALLAVSVPVFLRYRKRQTSTDEIDGGVRHYVDTNAPKTIESNQIIFFSCKFSTRDLLREDTPLAGNVFTLYAAENSGSMELHYPADDYEDRRFIPTPEFFVQLQRIVAQYDLAKHNGQHYTVSGLPPDFGVKLEIRYDSGETIRASDNQSCFLPLEAMEALVALFQKQ